MSDYFSETLNMIDRMIGERYKDLKAHAERKGVGTVTVYIQADCRACPARIVARANNDMQGWASDLVDAIVSLSKEHDLNHTLIVRGS